MKGKTEPQYVEYVRKEDITGMIAQERRHTRIETTQMKTDKSKKQGQMAIYFNCSLWTTQDYVLLMFLSCLFICIYILIT